jgi:hypothetical protein
MLRTSMATHVLGGVAAMVQLHGDFAMRCLRSMLLFLPFLSTLAYPQTPTMDVFCNAGLRPDGYVDLAAMPKAPNFPSAEEGLASSAPFTVTLPVTGIAGLTVQVTIPALAGLQAGPIYTVTNGTLLLNGFAAANGTIMTLAFSGPVSGVGLVTNSFGRQADFTLQTEAPGSEPANFENTADTLTIAPKFYSIPLQQVDMQVGFTNAYVLFGGSPDFGTPSLSNIRVQSRAAAHTTLVPREGLQQWLVSESAQNPLDGGAASWPDQSGNDHPATQTVAAQKPGQVQGDGNACQAAFSFNGSQYFNFHLPIDSWQQMTIFLVAKSSGTPPAGSAPAASAAIFWNENALWGNTFLTPLQATEVFRFGTTQAGNQPIYSRPVTVGEDFTVTRAVHDGATDSLYVDGVAALRQANKLPVLSGTTGAGFIGRGLNNTYFKGEISEVLVYNRVLSPDETAIVESYLRNKFGTR